MKKSRLLGALCAVVFTFITVSTNAALVGRLPISPGGTDFQAAYDDVLNITWVTDASFGATNTWDDQTVWASSLNHLGYADWRLASVSVSAGLPTGSTSSVIDCSTATELACRDNELGYMYYYNLATVAGPDKRGTHTIGDVTLSDIQANHWSSTELNSDFAWIMKYFDGTNPVGFRDSNNFYGWAVADGDVFAAPIPASAWLFGSGLLGLVGIARRKNA